MALSRIDNGDGTLTVRFDFTYPTAKVSAAADNAAEWLYKRATQGLTAEKKIAAGYPLTYAEVTQAQKAAWLFEAVRETLHAWQQANIAAQEDAIKQAAIDSREPGETFDA